MKKIYKIITLIMIILILLFCMNTRVSAIGEIIEDGQSFLGAADPGTVNVSIGAIEGASGYLYNILLSAGIVIAVIIATVLGVQFMLSEAEGQAKVKEMLIPYIIGCIVVFGGFGIWKLALELGKNIEGTIQTSSMSNQYYIVSMKK